MKVLFPSCVKVISGGGEKRIKRESDGNNDVLKRSCTFKEERHEGDDGRLQFGDGQSVRSVVS